MLHERLRYERITLGLTQEEVAAKLDITPASYGLYEQNRRHPDYDILIKLAKLFSCSVDYLICNDIKVEPNDYGKKLGLTEEEIKEALEFAAKMKKKP
jgi:transcriptional regulator with XRE-family HTH domain